MEQYFNVTRIYTSMDMGIGNRSVDTEHVPVSSLAAGEERDFLGNKLGVVSIDAKELSFTFRGETYCLNREWQLIGTPDFSIPNIYIRESERFVFHCSCPPKSVFKWNSHKLLVLNKQLWRNTEAGDIWKNIPLARQYMHILKDLTPWRDSMMTPPCKAHLIWDVLTNNMISVRETPRLFQSYCELYRLCLDLDIQEDYKGPFEDIAEDFDKDYFREIDNYIYSLCWINEKNFKTCGIEAWNRLGMLRCDPVQASPQWEEVIYEVEQEIAEELQDLPRGMGFCFAYWTAKKAALARRGIEWRTPGIMNPGVMFD